jgi:small-conductance mechanosensitive channel
VNWDTSLRWALGLGVGFPLLLLLLNEATVRGRRNGSVLTPTLLALRNWLLPTLGLALLCRQVLDVSAGSTLDRVLWTVVYSVALYVLLAFLNDIVFGAAAQGTWRAGVPSLLRDLLRSLLVGAGLALVYSFVWEKELAGALTALGVGSLVIGLALQEPLGNVFSGLMLLAERPVAIGDWVNVEGQVGRVIEMNWRAVNFQTFTNDMIVAPNSSLYKASFMNLSRPTAVRTECVELRFSFDEPPNRVKEVLLQMLRDTPGVLPEPTPQVQVSSYNESTITYQVYFSFPSMADLYTVRDAVLTRVWYATRRADIALPLPVAVEIGEEAAVRKEELQPNIAQELAPFPLFHSQSPATLLEFAEGETLLQYNDEQDGLGLLVSGRAVMLGKDANGRETVVAQLQPGDFYGENSILAGQVSIAAIRAETDVRVVLFDLETARRLMEGSTRLAREIGATIESRRKAVDSLRRSRSATA